MTVADGARRVDIEKLRVIKTYVKLFLDIFFWTLENIAWIKFIKKDIRSYT